MINIEIYTSDKKIITNKETKVAVLTYIDKVTTKGVYVEEDGYLIFIPPSRILEIKCEDSSFKRFEEIDIISI